MIKPASRVRRTRPYGSQDAGYMPADSGARMSWTISAGQEEQVAQLSAFRRAGVVMLMALLMLAVPMYWAPISDAAGPQATLPPATTTRARRLAATRRPTKPPTTTRPPMATTVAPAAVTRAPTAVTTSPRPAAT